MIRVTRSSRRKEELQRAKLEINSNENSTDKNTNLNGESEIPNNHQKSSKPPRSRRPAKSKSSSDIQLLSPVTPPKQRKSNGSENHNAEVSVTPSSLFKRLSLKSPLKKSAVSARASLFNSKQKVENTEQNQEITKGSGSIPEEAKIYSQYQNARKALHSNFPTELPGRENEIKELRNFILGHLENGSSGSIYVSGPPGTGKTASLNSIVQHSDISSKVQQIYINCTAIKSATAVYSRLIRELNIKSHGKSEKDNLLIVEKYLQKKHKMLLIVLDEIDQLETKNHSILYTIFEWPSKPNSRLILVGIANALDLTDRTLPRLQARCELKPNLLHFAPYTKEQIVKIFTSRLESAGVLNVFTPIALQMLAGKVASISGDVRRALDIGRRVIEFIDQNDNVDVLKSVENFTNELTENQAPKTEQDAKPKTVNLKEVVSVLNNVYGTTQNLNDDTEETFPLQQKIVICSLLLMLKKAKNKDITIGKLHEVYSRICRKQNLMAVDQAEFSGLCSLIETRGIIRVTGRKEPRMHKVSLEWNDTEVAEALKDKQLMSVILQDETCLGKI
ncbi:hypothetical protein GWI33_017932 [Rhynchophorus ferrugineus]|uniref:Cell division control protein n=1 Tax=Rhynchophorus ferrugineus TaxID=354439 RepID=A0A834M5T5_RHYFE|nr:hypothetical protein GWI33_017932 [Rhynchophorus ferrugineus]